jgi:hypothetical protein
MKCETEDPTRYLLGCYSVFGPSELREGISDYGMLVVGGFVVTPLDVCGLVGLTLVVWVKCTVDCAHRVAKFAATETRM